MVNSVWILIVAGYLSTIKGFVKDSITGKPLEYAVVVVYDTTGKQIQGTYTDEEGLFVIKGIKPGIYYLIADYIGYKKTKTKYLNIHGKIYDVGTIYLKPAYLKMKEVVVKGRPEKINVEVDKIVIRPKGDIISEGGTAKDVLRGVPGVKVGINGEVEIKNSKNYIVLINGKPTMMEPEEALKEIPASEIEKIELITNPGAEYDPESNAIVNIILKGKGTKFGRSINVRLGTNQNYGASVLWGIEKEKTSFYINIPYFKYGEKMLYDMEVVRDTDTMKVFNSSVTNIDNPASLRAGIVYTIDKNSSFGIEGKLGRYIFETRSDMKYTTTDNKNLHVPLSEKWTSNVYALSLDFTKKLENHNRWDINLYAGNLKSNKDLDNPQIYDDSIIGGTRTQGNGSRKRIRIDVKHQGKIWHLEYKTGYRYEEKNASSTTLNKFYGDTTYETKLAHKRELHAGFIKLNGDYSKLGYSAGVRIEYAKRRIDTIHFKSMDIFPSFYVSYRSGGLNTMTLSYTRRIKRPDAFSLNPVKVWVLPNEAHAGNPNLKPEYINSLEFNFGTIIKTRISLNLTLSYIYKQNYIYTVREVTASGDIISREMNLRYRKDIGGGLVLSWTPVGFANISFTPDVWLYEFINGNKKKVRDIKYEIPVNIQTNLPFGGLQLFAIYTSPYEEEGTRYSSNFITQLAFMTKIHGFTISAGFIDAFHTFKLRSYTDFSDGFRRITARPAYPFIFVDIRFTKNRIKKVKSVKESISSDIKGL